MHNHNSISCQKIREWVFAQVTNIELYFGHKFHDNILANITNSGPTYINLGLVIFSINVKQNRKITWDLEI